MKKYGIIILVLLIIGAGVIYFYVLPKEKPNLEKEPEQVMEPVKLKIVDEDSKTRPYAVMINNNQAAWPNHAGLNDAYLVYEIITEGGITRLMAIFKDQITARIGSVRSARHYFLDYALENDAIYVHFGWSPMAQKDIKELGINNINGLYDTSFWRDRTLGVAYEHTAYTSMELLSALASKKGYVQKTNQKLLLNYSTVERGVRGIENAVVAKKVIIPYSRAHTTSYEYDETSKTYLRYMNGNPHIDGVSKEQYHTKNIIIQLVENFAIDSYGRQDIKNVTTGNGYYITNGFAAPITWTKESRSAQTKYTYLNGSEIIVNDGNTYIQIEPSSMTPTFEDIESQ